LNGVGAAGAYVSPQPGRAKRVIAGNPAGTPPARFKTSGNASYPACPNERRNGFSFLLPHYDHEAFFGKFDTVFSSAYLSCIHNEIYYYHAKFFAPCNAADLMMEAV